MSLRALHGAKQEETSLKARDEARWQEAEQLVTALKESNEPPPTNPLPRLHSKGTYVPCRLALIKNTLSPKTAACCAHT